MPRICGLVLSGWIVVNASFAQTVAEGMAKAQVEIDARRWSAALGGLLGLREAATDDTEREQLAAKLQEVGNSLSEEAAFDAALRAHEAALAIRKRSHGDRDHPEVARSLNNVAGCLHSLGRAGEALPRFEAALAMDKRIYGEADHPDVAKSLNDVAYCLHSLGRAGEALPQFEAALAMGMRIHGEADHSDVARSLNNLGRCLRSLGRAGEALPQYEAALAMSKRIHGEADHADVAQSLNNVALCLRSLGRAGEALPQLQAALAMWRRLHDDRDHPHVAMGLDNVALCLRSLGRAGEALPQFEAALAMRKRIHGDRDHPDVARSLNNVAGCLEALGRAGEALPQYEAALATRRRIYADRDHPDVALSLNDVAGCLQSLGRSSEALPQYEAALAMWKRIHGEADHPDVATSLNDFATCLQSLGRAGDALPLYEAALAMYKRIHGDRGHPYVARSLNNVAACLESLGRAGEALPQYEAALAMKKRIYGDRDHPDVSNGLNNVGFCLDSLGRAGEALPQYEAALAMGRRIHRDRDHPDLATRLNNVAACLCTLGRAGEALPQCEAALAMWRRIYGDRDHPDVARSLNHVAACLQFLGHPDKALRACAEAAAMIERLRDDTRTSADLRRSSFDDMKRGEVFERLQRLAAELGRPADSMLAAERSRGRELLDCIEQQRFEPELEAERRARQRGDETTAARVRTLRAELEAARAESDRLLHKLTKLADSNLTDAERASGHQQLLAQSNAVGNRQRQLNDERARLLGDVLPVGRVRTPAEIQSALREGELLLEFTVTERVSLLHVLAREGEVETVALPAAFATVRGELDGMLRRSLRPQLMEERGRDPSLRALFDALIPRALWPRLQASKRVFVAAHRALHRLPFELLVTDIKDGQPVPWIDSGPPISYVPSGSALHWLRQRAGEVGGDGTSLDLLAVADPSALAAEPEVPEQGVFLVAVDGDGEATRVGLQPGDVITSYDRQPLADDKALRDVLTATDAAIKDGRREKAPIAIGVWHRGQQLELQVRPGLLGIRVAPGRARTAAEAALSSDAKMERIMRNGDLERLRKLPPLQGARAETEAIERTFAAHNNRTKRLLGADATEPAVFDLAAKAKYVHFACHGIAEEYAGLSLSMLVLSQPERVLPGDDGLLKLGDLLHAWRGRLSSCRLVVLAACRTNVGPTFRDDAPQALPIGFLFAGVPSVISSLWPVDDASTRELMTDFYSRLLAGEDDKLAAFTVAKKALRAKYPDPFHWAPFLFLGSPE
ncbi:MAG TPA: tetratricopeptide repeat protein [Planctomycetota bacterium]|nr:tetratricopeptide repeat protein [Planctomycetota bacterium]